VIYRGEGDIRRNWRKRKREDKEEREGGAGGKKKDHYTLSI